jgi:riboflavin biosynthesis pyrimidine reductase
MKSRRIVIRHPRKKEPVLWVVDSEQWPRACLRAELIERGFDPYGFITIGDALDSLSRTESSKPEVIILELREQNLTTELVQAIRNLRITTILLGGNAELNEPLIQQEKWEIVLKRPVSLGKIADVVQEIVSKHRTAALDRKSG